MKETNSAGQLMPGGVFLCTHYFLEGNHHEIALEHEGMRDFQIGRVDDEVVIEQDVNVDDTVVIDAARRFLCASHLPFDVLCSSKQFKRSKHGLHTHSGIHEAVGRRESPRLSGIKRRLAYDMANLRFDFLYGPADMAPFVAKIRAKT